VTAPTDRFWKVLASLITLAWVVCAPVVGYYVRAQDRRMDGHEKQIEDVRAQRGDDRERLIRIETHLERLVREADERRRAEAERAAPERRAR